MRSLCQICSLFPSGGTEKKIILGQAAGLPHTAGRIGGWSAAHGVWVGHGTAYSTGVQDVGCMRCPVLAPHVVCNPHSVGSTCMLHTVCLSGAGT